MYSAKTNEKQLRSLVQLDKRIKVYRDKHLRVIPVDQLVPGDLCVLESGEAVVADMAIVSGEAVMDESSLTGESHPVPKHQLPRHGVEEEHYKSEKFRGNSIFCGSTIVLAKPASILREVRDEGLEKTHCLAVVVATGFSTSKGELFRTILFPNELNLKFNRGILHITT
jgi:P-type E1-E2 ATPase